jgi:hypothetical protein
VIGQLREHILLSPRPSVVVIMSYVNHVIGVDGSEGSKAVTNDGEESDQDAIYDVHNINLPATDVDPADEEQYPGKSEKCDKGSIECDQEAKGWCLLALYTLLG